MHISGSRARAGSGGGICRVVAIAGLLGAVAAIVAPPGASAAKPRLGPAIAAPIQRYRLFDIGITDLDRDGWQDIFTTNHKFPSSLLLGDRGRRFRRAPTRLRLPQDERFPGLGRMRAPEDRSQPGIYIWVTDRPGEPSRLHLESTGLAAKGMVELTSRQISILRSDGATARLWRTEATSQYRSLEFTIEPGGRLTLAAGGLSDVPVRFAFTGRDERAVDAGQIKVGYRMISPAALRFDFALRDRHAVAFADLTDGESLDAFVETGGHGGTIEDRFLGWIEDQLFVSGAGPRGGYGDRHAGSGIEKGPCRGRAAAWVDYDGDGLLDLFTTCEGIGPRLYRRVGPLRFQQVQAPDVVARAYRWAKLDGGRPALLASTEEGLEVWRLGSAGWQLSQSVPAGRRCMDLAVGDWDRSGTLDVLVAGRRGAHLLSNRDGRLREVPRRRAGLPGGSVAGASFTDFDNDGRLDVSLLPQGLYRWSARRGRFLPTGRMRTRKASYGSVQWMDYDNDGRRDPVIAASQREFSPRSRILRRHNLTRGGHWLEVVLRGRAGNGVALGARVAVWGRGPRPVVQWVGQNDDARHSQGHYRLYFGLGRAARARRLVVHWPDGSVTRRRRVRAGRLLTIRQPEARPVLAAIEWVARLLHVRSRTEHA